MRGAGRSRSPRRRIRTRRASALLAAAALLTSCGGGARREAAPPKLARSDAAQLILLADTVARDARTSPCAARREIDRLKARAIALVNARRVPAALQEPLMGGVNALALEAPACVTAPAPAAARAPAPAPAPGRGHHGKAKGHEKRDGHGKDD